MKVVDFANSAGVAKQKALKNQQQNLLFGLSQTNKKQLIKLIV
jgi:hypothetical protein